LRVQGARNHLLLLGFKIIQDSEFAIWVSGSGLWSLLGWAARFREIHSSGFKDLIALLAAGWERREERERERERERVCVRVCVWGRVSE